ncbi:universal stress protein [Amycolatopsis sp. CA-230715]|uniref:universal stress protein n=1 Tax=Amycolatopsis sp. CA-230715 TaxID=2745196 RepID=UPI001C021526|nr:universal stress protein [Amycolatopsis sp. CA-230715]QWF77951.1 Universal stress protein [Amycolatopsis sp. CA-230715]
MAAGDRKDVIVVGVDGSQASAAALRWAVREAALSHRGVHVVRAWTFDPLPGPGTGLSRQRAEADRRRELDHLVADVRGETSPVEVVAKVVEDTPSAALGRASDGAAMLVLGSHGHNRVLRLLVGSVTEQCLRAATCPVVVIPARTRAPRPPESGTEPLTGPLL